MGALGLEYIFDRTYRFVNTAVCKHNNLFANTATLSTLEFNYPAIWVSKNIGPRKYKVQSSSTSKSSVIYTQNT